MPGNCVHPIFVANDRLSAQAGWLERGGAWLGVQIDSIRYDPPGGISSRINAYDDDDDDGDGGGNALEFSRA